MPKRIFVKSDDERPAATRTGLLQRLIDLIAQRIAQRLHDRNAQQTISLPAKEPPSQPKLNSRRNRAISK
jgi:hypothetical protein